MSVTIESEEKSGRILLRLPKSMHAMLIAESEAESTSLNQLILTKVSLPLAAALGYVRGEAKDQPDPAPREKIERLRRALSAYQALMQVRFDDKNIWGSEIVELNAAILDLLPHADPVPSHNETMDAAIAEVTQYAVHLATLGTELEIMKSRHERLSERHWTCMKCGGSWYCERADVPKDRGNSTPAKPCPWCELIRLRAALERYGDHDSKCDFNLPTIDEDGCAFHPPCTCGLDAAIRRRAGIEGESNAD